MRKQRSLFRLSSTPSLRGPACLATAAGLSCLLAACIGGHPDTLMRDPPPPADTAGSDAARLSALDAWMGEQAGARGYVGAVWLVAHGDRIVDWRASGHRDLARTDPMRRDAIFRIYSMTKPITTVALLMLVDDGVLTLDDPVARWVPGFEAMQVVDGGTLDAPRLRAATRPITLRHLLTHTAGFAAGREGDGIADALMARADPHGARDLAGFAQRLSRVPLAADPGTRFGYDAAASELAARVVEVASGQRFSDFLQARVFDPLRMRDTGFEVPMAQRRRVVDITTLDADGRLRIADGPSAVVPGARLNPYDSGAGGLYSTASDYARFCRMLLEGGTLDGVRLLRPGTVDAMFANQLEGMFDPPVTQFSDAEGFGLGGYVVLDPVLRGVAGSPGTYGWSGAASTNFMIDRHQGVVAILMLQHLPREGDPRDLPRIGRAFQARVHQALMTGSTP